MSNLVNQTSISNSSLSSFSANLVSQLIKATNSTSQNSASSASSLTSSSKTAKTDLSVTSSQAKSNSIPDSTPSSSPVSPLSTQNLALSFLTPSTSTLTSSSDSTPSSYQQTSVTSQPLSTCLALAKIYPSIFELIAKQTEQEQSLLSTDLASSLNFDVPSALETIDEDFAPSIAPAPLSTPISSTFQPLSSSLTSHLKIKHPLPDLGSLLTDFDLPEPEDTKEDEQIVTSSPTATFSSSATLSVDTFFQKETQDLVPPSLSSTSSKSSKDPVDTTSATSTSLLETDSSSDSSSNSAPSSNPSSLSSAPTSSSPSFLKKGFSYLAIFLLMLGLNAGGFLAITNLAPNAEAGQLPLEEEPTSSASSQHILAFEGYLFNNQSVPLTGLQNIQFSLYDSSGADADNIFARSQAAVAESKGKQLWNSTYCEVWVNEKGFFSVNLGAGQGHNQDDFNCGSSLDQVLSADPAPSDIWLQINVEREALTPRQKLVFAPLDPSELNTQPPTQTSLLEGSRQFYFQPGYEGAE